MRKILQFEHEHAHCSLLCLSLCGLSVLPVKERKSGAMAGEGDALALNLNFHVAAEHHAASSGRQKFQQRRQVRCFPLYPFPFPFLLPSSPFLPLGETLCVCVCVCVG